MKPDEARRRQKLIETAKAARGEELEARLAGKTSLDKIEPDAIPTADDLAKVKTEFRKVSRRLQKTSRLTNASRYNEHLDELMVCLARIVFVERILRLDEVQRASLTVAQLVALSSITPNDLKTRLGQIRGETDLVVPS